MSIFLTDENIARYRLLKSGTTSDAERMALLETLKRQYADGVSDAKSRWRASNRTSFGKPIPSYPPGPESLRA